MLFCRILWYEEGYSGCVKPVFKSGRRKGGTTYVEGARAGQTAEPVRVKAAPSFLRDKVSLYRRFPPRLGVFG